MRAEAEGNGGEKEGEAGGSNQLSVISDRSAVSVLKGDRSGFLGLGQKLAGETNALVVIAWGHGGRQGKTPVLHVRGPRITAADFKAVASQAAARESRWVLMFRGSGAFASELAGEGRQIISSEGETMFSDDPVGMPLLLKMAKEKPELAFAGAGEELGRATEAWYTERNLARTEEPTLWVATDKPRHLVAPAAEDNALASVKPAEPEESGDQRGQRADPAVSRRRRASCRRCGRRSSGSRPGSIRRRTRSSCGGGLSYTLGSSPAIATEQEEFIQVLTPEGKHYGDFDVSYSPPHEDITFLDCEVLRAGWKAGAAGPGRDSRRATSNRWAITNRGSGSSFPCPGVSPARCCTCATGRHGRRFRCRTSRWRSRLGRTWRRWKRRCRSSVPKETPFHFALEQVAAADPGHQANDLRHDLLVALRESAARRSARCSCRPGRGRGC